MHRTGPLRGTRFLMPSHFHVFQPVVGPGIAIVRIRLDHHHLGGNRVPRRNLPQHRRRLEFVTHHHRFHETLDQVAINSRGLGFRIDGNDPSRKPIPLGIGWGIRAMAGRTRKSRHTHDANDKSAR